MVAGAEAAGGSAALITVTLQHHAGHGLADAWGALRYAWSRVASGKKYAAEMEQFGIDGWCVAVEVTHGEAGWHPYAHALVIFKGPRSQEMIEQLAIRWWTRGERALNRKGFTAIADRGGLDARRVVLTAGASGALGQYLSKIALEVTGGSIKDGRYGNRSPFALLRDGLATGAADDIEAWWEFEHASRGRRQLTWSQGIRDRYRVGPEQSDQEIAAEDVGSDDLIKLPAETWEVVRDQAEQLLTAAEVDGLAGAAEWLDRRGLRWSWARHGTARARARSTRSSGSDLLEVALR